MEGNDHNYFSSREGTGVEEHGRTGGDRKMMKDSAETMKMPENEQNAEISMERHPSRRTLSMLRALTQTKLTSIIRASN
jgi:hypothetical protein